MTHIDRLLKSSQNQRTRELLDAGLADTPPRGSLARVATGLGVVVGGSTWSAMAAGAGATASTAGAAAAPGALTLLGAGKLFAIGALAGTLVSGASVAIEHATTAPTPSVQTGPMTAAPKLAAPPGAKTEARAEATPPSMQTSETQEGPAPTPASPAPQASLRTPSDSGALAAEVARIDAARSALARGDRIRALSEIAAYRKERQLGVLDREATLLAIRAHSELGQGWRAKELAREYLAAHPDDAHAPRLRELVDEK
jgi:hypothetical protein